MTVIEGLEPHWLWLGLGLLLAIGEMTIPGVFLIWMAGSAL
jgi:membrane protein implicated in regulation of membrane protease activity